MAPGGLNHRLTIPEHVIHQKVDDEIVLLNLETGIYHGLGPVGTRFWELLLKQDSLQSVFEEMLKEYDVNSERLQDDILRLVHELETNKLIVVAA